MKLYNMVNPKDLNVRQTHTTSIVASALPTIMLSYESEGGEPRCHLGIDIVRFTSKPNGKAVGGIKSRLVNSTVEATPADIIAAIKHGQTICPACIDGTYGAHRADYWHSQQIYFVDIDNAAKDKSRLPDDKYIPTDKARQILLDNGINPFFIYHSFSSKCEFEKFRICVRLDTVVTNKIEREHIIKAFVALFGDAADKSCTNADRIFFGSSANCSVYEDTRAITSESVMLALYDKLFPSGTAPEVPLQTLPVPIVPAFTGGDWVKDFDFDIDILLACLDPDCDYSTWISSTAAYKGAGGDLETWAQWSARSPKWKDGDRQKWFSLKGTNRGALINLAKQTSEGAAYMDGMRQAQSEAKEKYKEAHICDEWGNHGVTNAPNDDAPVPKRQPLAKAASEFGEFKPEFVYYPYIPKHEYTVLLAESGTDKSMLCCGIAAAISKGECLPGDETTRKAGKVLFISSEDKGECIRQRALLAGANVNNIMICDRDVSKKLSFVGDGMRELTAEIKQHAPELVIIDPWQAFVGKNVDLNKMNQTRPILQSIAQLAQETDCGILLISHVNKRAQGENANFAASGSTELINAARSAIKIEYDHNPEFPDDKDARLAIHTKSNYSGLGKTIAYSTANGYVTWRGFSDIDRNTIELAARTHKTIYEALKLQRADKADYTDLMRAIADLSAMSKDKTVKILYEELELYSNQGHNIWNGKNPNQRKKIIDLLKPTLKADYHLIVEVIPYPIQKECFDKAVRQGRGISVQTLYVKSDDTL